jgi:hypothetical protein
MIGVGVVGGGDFIVFGDQTQAIIHGWQVLYLWAMLKSQWLLDLEKRNLDADIHTLMTAVRRQKEL